ncbi:unnamed protein product [Dovyalis caffra]|uniref:WAT1-related protein n=1 Tax=Dovyalis caffra TaxID=77055 RepID=A0AAV1SU97_9ROSI|nr:unnamed protein product [Dovyalis caffra]
MSDGGQWKPVFGMVVVNFAFAIVNLLLKKMLDQGTNNMVIATYRLSISAIFLAPIAYYWESLEKANMTSKAGKAKVLGTFICMGGAVLLILYKGMPLTNSHSEATTTDILNHADTTISGCFTWSSWFLMQTKISKNYPCQYSSTAIMSISGAIQSAVLGLIMERNFAMWILKPKLEIIGVLYAGIIGSGLCYVGMSWCVKQRGPVFTSAFTPFTQIFAAVFDFFILHEQIYLGSVLGSILVMLGLYILLWGKSNEAVNCSEKQAQLAEEEENRDTEAQISVINSKSNL